VYIRQARALNQWLKKELKVIGERGIVTELYNAAVFLIEPLLAESFTRQSRNQAASVVPRKCPQT